MLLLPLLLSLTAPQQPPAAALVQPSSSVWDTLSVSSPILGHPTINAARQQQALEELPCIPGTPQCAHACEGDEGAPDGTVARHQCHLMRDVYTLIETDTCAQCGSRNTSLRHAFAGAVHRTLGVRLDRSILLSYKGHADVSPTRAWVGAPLAASVSLPRSYVLFRVVAATEHAAQQLNATIRETFPNASMSSSVLDVDATSGAYIDVLTHSFQSNATEGPCTDQSCQDEYRDRMNAGIFDRSPWLPVVLCLLGGMTIFGVLFIFSMIVFCGRFHKPSELNAPLAAADGAAGSVSAIAPTSR